MKLAEYFKVSFFHWWIKSCFSNRARTLKLGSDMERCCDLKWSMFQLWIQIRPKIENIFKSRFVIRVVVYSQVCRPLLVQDRRQKPGWRRRIVNKEDLVAEELRVRVSSRLGPSPPSCSQSGIEAPKMGKSPKKSSSPRRQGELHFGPLSRILLYLTLVYS